MSTSDYRTELPNEKDEGTAMITTRPVTRVPVGQAANRINSVINSNLNTVAEPAHESAS